MPERGSSYLRGRIGEYLRQVAGGDEAETPAAPIRIPRKLYRVSEIARHLDVTRQTVHNYATMGLITEESQTEGGQRLFDESVFARLAQIQHLKRTYRLHEIRRLLDAEAAPGAMAAVGAVAPPAEAVAAAPTAPALAVETQAYLAVEAHDAAELPRAGDGRGLTASGPGRGGASGADAVVGSRDEKETPGGA